MAASDHSGSAMSPEVVPSATGSRTVTETLTQEQQQIPGPSSSQPPVLRLRLQKPRSGKKVQWTNGTVDNEHMNKKKSKCCCIYVKPREFGESSSESEDECEHCSGHVELRKKKQPTSPEGTADSTDGAEAAEPRIANDPPPDDGGNEEPNEN